MGTVPQIFLEYCNALLALRYFTSLVLIGVSKVVLQMTSSF